MGRGLVVDGHRLLGANVDITARHEAEEQEAMLMREVDHRAKNVLAVVLSLLRLTPREDSTLYARSVEGRVAAMARVHTLLAEGHWIGADLQEIAEAELEAYASPRTGAALHPDRITIAGPPVRLVPHAAQAMSVVLHELATNAGKYGALSVPNGHISILWRLESDGTLDLEWSESGGPPIEGVPVYQGFGSKLIDSTVRRQLGGDVRFQWEQKGLRCVITAPTAVRAESVAETELARES
jgi:two-component sensor histidine kinase